MLVVGFEIRLRAFQLNARNCQCCARMRGTKSDCTSFVFYARIARIQHRDLIIQLRELRRNARRPICHDPMTRIFSNCPRRGQRISQPAVCARNTRTSKICSLSDFIIRSRVVCPNASHASRTSRDSRGIRAFCNLAGFFKLGSRALSLNASDAGSRPSGPLAAPGCHSPPGFGARGFCPEAPESMKVFAVSTTKHCALLPRNVCGTRRPCGCTRLDLCACRAHFVQVQDMLAETPSMNAIDRRVRSIAGAQAPLPPHLGLREFRKDARYPIYNPITRNWKKCAYSDL